MRCYVLMGLIWIDTVPHTSLVLPFISSSNWQQLEKVSVCPIIVLLVLHPPNIIQAFISIHDNEVTANEWFMTVPWRCASTVLPSPMGRARVRVMMRLQWGFWSPLRHSPKPVLWAPQLTGWPKVGWAGGPRGEGRDLPLTTLSTSWPHSTVAWIPSLTVVS